MKIRLGPAGVPISCKKRDSISGIKRVAELGLNAMEIEFVRGVHMSVQTAKEVGKTAKDYRIELSCHAPYYVNLLSKDRSIVSASKKRILDTLERGHHMGAVMSAVHTGYYGKYSKEEAMKVVVRECRDILAKRKKKGWKTRLGLEVGGKLSAFASLEELIKLHNKLPGCVPVIDFAHIYARNQGKIDYSDVLKKMKKAGIRHVHSHFSNISYTKKGERSHLPMGKKPPFRPLAKEILKKKMNITIISESPVLEKDSLKMKKIFESLGYRKW